MKQLDFRDGQRWRVIKAGGSLWGWKSAGPHAQEGWRQDLAVGTIITCKGRSMSGGDGVPLIKWGDENGNYLAGDCEFRPETGGMWASAPADGYLELVLPTSVKTFDEVRAWTDYERCMAVENYDYKVDDWVTFAGSAPKALVDRASKFKKDQKEPTVIWDPNDDEDGYLLVCDGRWPKEALELCGRIAESATEGPLSVKA